VPISPWPPRDEAQDGWFEGLPDPLYDLRPQGWRDLLVCEQLAAEALARAIDLA
jgi:hypothetical protein